MLQFAAVVLAILRSAAAGYVAGSPTLGPEPRVGFLWCLSRRVDFNSEF